MLPEDPSGTRLDWAPPEHTTPMPTIVEETPLEPGGAEEDSVDVSVFEEPTDERISGNSNSTRCGRSPGVDNAVPFLRPVVFQSERINLDGSTYIGSFIQPHDDDSDDNNVRMLVENSSSSTAAAPYTSSSSTTNNNTYNEHDITRSSSSFVVNASVSDGPTFKDQVRSVVVARSNHFSPIREDNDDNNVAAAAAAATTTPPVATPTRSRYSGQNRVAAAAAAVMDSLTRAVGPAFKDQVRSRKPLDIRENDRAIEFNHREDNGRNPVRGGGAMVDSCNEKLGPAFKDQMRTMHLLNDNDELAEAHLPSQSTLQSRRKSQKPNVRQSEESSLSQISGGENAPVFIDVHFLDNGQANIDDELPPNYHDGLVYEADAFALKGGYFVKRRVIIGVAAFLVAAVAVLGGVCGSGKCQRDSNNIPLTISAVPTAAPTTLAPTTMAPSSEPSSMPSLRMESAAMVEFINSVTLSGMIIEFPAPPDSVTSEERALEWLIQDDPLLLSAVDPTDMKRLTQRYALLTLWYSLKGDGWSENTGWLVGADECAWFGVECINNEVISIGVVSPADLLWRQNNLSGTIPADIALLRSLTRIYLGENRKITGSLPSSMADLRLLQSFTAVSCSLSGSLPEAIGGWNSILEFSINDNAFTGTLPLSLANWTSLDVLWAAENQLHGTLSDSFGAWTKLSELYLRDNFFTGVLPESIGNWTRLTHVDVSDNMFNGTLPSSVGNGFSQIKRFDVSSNRITGSLPSSLSNWSGIDYFAAHVNSITGTLPENLGFWQNVKFFRVDDNQMSGSLPASIGQWTGIAVFQVYGNAFTGTIPDTLSQWEAITDFGIEFNNFSGSLPSFIGSWTQLISFTVNVNGFNGTIPSSVGNWSDADVIRFADNKFEGVLPEAIGEWNALRKFNASHNDFTGTLPQSVGQWTGLSSFEISGCPSLTGSIPESIAQWQIIAEAYFNGTALEGSIPDELCQQASFSDLVADCEEVDCSCCSTCY